MPRQRGAYARGLAVHAEEAQRAEADNAALLKLLKSVEPLMTYVADNWEDESTETAAHGAASAARKLLSTHHPGAALLEELEGLRAENERLKQERNHWEGRAALTASEVAAQVVREPIAIRVEGIPEPMRAVIEQTARDAALEEAAKVVQKFSAEWQKVADEFRTDKYRAKWNLAAELGVDVENEIRAMKGTK